MEENSVYSYLRYVRYCIDEQPCIPTITDWNALFVFMKEQALLGVGFHGIERMKKEGVDVPRNVLLQWYAVSEQIKQRNVLMNKRCVELVEMLKKDGFESCILKGQGNTVMYGFGFRDDDENPNLNPAPNDTLTPNDTLNGNFHPSTFQSFSSSSNLGMLRQSGDIDVFVMPMAGSMVEVLEFRTGSVHKPDMTIEQRRKVVMEYVRRRFPLAKIRYQHIDYPVFSDVEVEMHFIPTAKNNPIYNRRLQRWVEERMAEQCHHFVELPGGAGQVATPTVEFNVIYQLSHLMHHFFDEGIGLRQMMDYYFLLKAKNGLGFRDENTERTLRYLGLYKFAGAVMWVLHEVFGLEEKFYIVPTDEWRGKLLLEEIIKGGNFGHFSGLTDHSIGTKYFLKIKRNMRFVRAYPAEALCEPVFRTWHFFWRLLNG